MAAAGFYRLDDETVKARFSVEYSPTEGRFGVASEDFAPGATILVEHAVASAPRLSDNDGAAFQCFWCCSPLEAPADSHQCGKCRAVFCSAACASGSQKIHQALECGRLPALRQLAERSGYLTPSVLLLAGRLVVLLAHLGLGASTDVEPLPAGNPLLRCFLVEHARLDSIFALESHEALLDGPTRDCLLDTGRMLLRMLNSKLRPLVSLDQVVRIFCVLNINVHGLQFFRNRPLPSSSTPTTSAGESVNFGIGLFPTLSLLNHSCQPNTQMSFSAGNTVRLRANRAIKKGDAVTMSYIDLYLPPLKRRVKLLRAKYFLCTCPRCLTATADDLEIGAQLCSKCAQGLVLPPLLLPLSTPVHEQLETARRVATDPRARVQLLQSVATLVGQCQHCGHAVKWTDISKCEKACKQLLKNALAQPPDLRYDSLDALVSRQSTFFSRLHRRHYLITLLQVQLMSSAVDRRDASHQLVAIKHIEHILENVDKTYPPYNLERAVFCEQHGDICQSLAARDPTNKGAFIRLLGQALIFYDRAIEQYTVALGPDHPNTAVAQAKAYALRQFIHD